MTAGLLQIRHGPSNYRVCRRLLLRGGLFRSSTAPAVIVVLSALVALARVVEGPPIDLVESDDEFVPPNFEQRPLPVRRRRRPPRLFYTQPLAFALTPSYGLPSPRIDICCNAYEDRSRPISILGEGRPYDGVSANASGWV
jgi:hypothetical protein